MFHSLKESQPSYKPTRLYSEACQKPLKINKLSNDESSSQNSLPKVHHIITDRMVVINRPDCDLDSTKREKYKSEYSGYIGKIMPKDIKGNERQKKGHRIRFKS